MNKLRYELFKLKGIVKDIEPVELMNGAMSDGIRPNVWTAGSNVHFDNESTHRVGGYLGFADPLPEGSHPVFALNVLTPAQSYWIWVDESTDNALIYVTNGTNHFNITDSPNLVTDGGFDDPLEWEFINAGTDSSQGVLYTTTDIECSIKQPFTTIGGDGYDITFDIIDNEPYDSAVNSVVEVSIGGGSSAVFSDVGTHTVRLVSAGLTNGIEFVTDLLVPGTVDIIIDNVSVKAVNGSTISKNEGYWSGCILNGVPVLNNGIDSPFWWDGNTSNPVETITGWPADQRCSAIRSFKYHLIALNLTRNSVQIPELYAWSNSADPGTLPTEWDATPSNDAGDNILATSDGQIIDGLALRDSFVIYKAHATFIMDYVGGQFVFSVRKLFNTSGIQALNCVQELRGHHWVFTDDDVIMHDGNTFNSIADNKIRKVMLGGINPDAQQLALVVANAPTDEIWFCLPGVDSPRLSTALIYSFTDQAWGVRYLPEVSHIAVGIFPEEGTDPTWDGAISQWDDAIQQWSDSSYSITNDRLMMCAPEQSKLYNVDASDSNDGEPLYAMIERTDWTIGGEDMIWDNVLVRSIYPIMTGQGGDVISVQIAGTQSPGESVQWSTPQDYVIGNINIKIDAIVHGRFLNVRFSSTGGSPWGIHRIGVEYVQESKY